MNRIDDEWFEQVYAEDPDPWGFDSRWFEARKRALTLAALPRARYRSAFEPGCAMGHLTVGLAARCDQVLSIDPVEAMVEQATRRVADAGPACWNVVVRRAAIPEGWPDPSEETFDLIVLSEVGYYLDAGALDEVVDRIGVTLGPGGDLVAVHWVGETDYPSSGEAVHRTLDACQALEPLLTYRQPEFWLQGWRRR